VQGVNDVQASIDDDMGEGEEHQQEEEQTAADEGEQGVIPAAMPRTFSVAVDMGMAAQGTPNNNDKQHSTASDLQRSAHSYPFPVTIRLFHHRQRPTPLYFLPLSIEVVVADGPFD
jgi:hypothetical protein